MMNIFDALADPTRRRILDLLRERPRLVNELAELLLITQPSASKHLRVLREVGLVHVRQEGQRHWYVLHVAPLVELDAWLMSYHQAQDKHYDRLDAYLNTLQASETDRKHND